MAGSYTRAINKYMDATAAFLHNCEERRLSDNTVQQYARHLTAFMNFMNESGMNSSDPGLPEVMAYRDEMRGAGKKPTTINQHIVTLHAFFDFASDPTFGDDKWYEMNPVSYRRLAVDSKEETVKPYAELLNNEQISMLLHFKRPTGESEKLFPRNYAIVMLMLCTGLRTSELIGLTPADLDEKYGEITVRSGKGNKFRIVDYPELAQTAVKLYLKSGVRPDDADDNAPLFGSMLSGKWETTNRNLVTEAVERHVYAVTGVHDIRAHDLRHLYARIRLNGGAHLEELQASLGHSNPSTTQIYSGRLAPRRHREAAQELLGQFKNAANTNREKLMAQ